jgi:omega-6 fatty acid desaturase (delta-12 desaturase)
MSFIPYKYWAKGHNYHHGHNGLLHEHRDIGDIDLLTSDEYRMLSKWGRLKYRIFRSFPVLFLIVPTYYVLLHNRLPLINLKGWSHARRSLLFSNIGLVVFCVLMYFLLGWQALVLVQLPILMAFGTIAIWFFYVQHQHEMSYKAWKDTWDYALSAFKGSTYYKLPKLIHWLSGNIGYHHIHHLNPLVPNYELAKCHHENPIFDELSTHMTFKQSLSCIFNKLWDEQEQRLISFKEFYMLEKRRAAC